MTDARAMAGQTSAARWLAIVLVAIGVAGGVWLAMGSSQGAGEPTGAAPGQPESVQGAIETTATLAPRREEPADYRIDEGGRLSLEATSLPAGGAVTLGLALDEKALGAGEDPLPVVVVSASDGRRLELSATPVAGRRSGVRLDIDAAWLRPGLYMIQVRTAEKTPLPLRRYVLEVSAALAPQTLEEVPADLR
jgi:hypothetical protein